MKKIGIITFHRAHNYGAMLQAYALQEYLKKYDVKIIDFNDKNINRCYKIIRVNEKNVKGNIKSIISDMLFLNKNIRRYYFFNKFLKNNMKLTQKYKSKKSLMVNYPKFDIYITGSDQVWNPNIVGKIDDIYTLNFGEKKIKRISYAASIGISKLKKSDYEKLIEDINKIDKISVRERSAKELLEKKIVKKNIEVVLDPTFLIKKEEWEKKFRNKFLIKEEYIFAYEVDYNEEYIKIVNELSKRTNLKVVYFEKRNKGYNKVLKNMYCSGPKEFVMYLKNAKYVVTSSFHATAFSIIFNKNLWVVAHKVTGSRTADLLKMCKLENRIVKSYSEFLQNEYDEEIDYEKVNKIIEKMRKKSTLWLENSINE